MGLGDLRESLWTKEEQRDAVDALFTSVLITRGLGLSMSRSGPNSTIWSLSDVGRIVFSVFGSPLLYVGHGGVPAIWQQSGYVTPSVSRTSLGTLVTEIST